MSTIDETRLFQANNHSKFKIGWKKVSLETEAEVKKILDNKFGIEDVYKVKQVDEWERMSNNFLVVSDSNVQKKYLLRKYLNVQSKDKIEDITQIAQYLRENNIPTPVVIPTKRNEIFSDYEGYFWQVFGFIDGSHYEGTPFQLKDIASKIAIMHIAMAKCPFEVDVRQRSPWKECEWYNFFNILSEDKTPLNKRMLLEKDFILSCVNEVNRKYDKKTQKMQPVHGDLHPQNTIYSRNRLVALLDFADVCIAERARDVGNACHRFTRQYVVNQKGKWQDKLPLAVNTFLKVYNTLNPLTNKEVESLQVLIKDELLRKIHLDLELYFSTGDPVRFEGGEFEKKIELLKEADVIGKIINSG
jgi:Ser/Thr protein kinase RdoA (MazF antagonist)